MDQSLPAGHRPPTHGEVPEQTPVSGSTFRRLAPLCFTMFCGFSTVSVPLPVLPLYVHEQLGFNIICAGLTVGLQSFATLVTRTHAGRAVDRIGPKLTLIRGLLILSCAGLLYGLSSIVPLPAAMGLSVLLTGRVVLGVGESFLVTGVLNWAIARAGEGRAGRAMSWNGMAQYGALAAGAPVGLAVYEIAGFNAIAILTVLLPLVALASVWTLEAVPARQGRPRSVLSVVKTICLPGVGLMLGGFGFAALSTFSTLSYAARGWEGGGLAITAFGLAFIAMRLFGGHLPDRFGPRKIAMASLMTEALGQAVTWLAPDPSVYVAGAALTGIGCALLFPSLGVEVVRRISAENRGVALGVFAAFQDLAIGLSGPVLGLAAGSYGISSAFLGGLIAAAIGVSVCAFLGD